MVHEALVTHTVKKGKQYIRVVPGQFVSPDLSALGFTAVTVEGAPAWERIFNPGTVRQLRTIFGADAISNELIARLAEYSLDNFHRANSDTIWKDDRLRQWQKPAVTFLAERERAFLALAPGLGKTFCALRAVDAARYRKVLVVAPLGLLDNWRKEIERWLPGTYIVKLYSDATVRYGNVKSSRVIILMGYESFQKLYAESTHKDFFELMIFDETILLKNRDTIRYSGRAERKGLTGRILPAVTGIFDLVKQHKGSVWMLSGGPTAKLIDDMWAQLHLLDSKRFSSYWQFAKHYCIVEETKWGLALTGNKPNATEILKRDIEDIYYSKTQHEVSENIPDFLFEDIEIEMAPEQAAAYTQMEKEFLAQLPSGDEIVATNMLTQLLRLTQIASNSALLEDHGIIPTASPKWDAVASLIEFVEGPVLLWTNFIRSAATLGKVLQGKKIALLTGEIDKALRQQVVDDFQAGKIDVLIAHPAVGKYGYTLTQARTALYVERSYNGDNYYQSLYRIKRIGTEKSPRIIHVLSTNQGRRTVDHAIGDVLRYRHENTERIITSRVLREAWEGTLVKEPTQ